MAPIVSLVSVDLVLSVLAFVLAYKFRHDADLFVWKRSLPPRARGRRVPALPQPAAVRPGRQRLRAAPVRAFQAQGGVLVLRRFHKGHKSLDDVVSGAGIDRVPLPPGLCLPRRPDNHLDFSYSRLVFVYDWILSAILFWLTLCMVRVIQIFYRTREQNLIPTIVVGCGEMAEVCITEMFEKPRLGYKLVGVVTARVNEDASHIQKCGVRKLGPF